MEFVRKIGVCLLVTTPNLSQCIMNALDFDHSIYTLGMVLCDFWDNVYISHEVIVINLLAINTIPCFPTKRCIMFKTQARLKVTV